MGKMKIKVKPEGAKLVFGGGDLEVDMHPAHGYVRPINNVVVSHAFEEHHEEPEARHEIEHEEHVEEHSGHHEDHHDDDHHDYGNHGDAHEYSHHDDQHEYSHDDDHHEYSHHDNHHENGHHDDDGYGFRHGQHWPMNGLNEQGFIGHEFFDNHHGGNHGYSRDGIGDADSDQNSNDNAASRHEIAEMKLGRPPGSQEEAENVRGESKDQTLAVQRLNIQRPDSVIYGSK